MLGFSGGLEEAFNLYLLSRHTLWFKIETKI